MRSEEFVTAILARVTIVLVNAVLVWCAFRLLHPHVPEVTVTNAIGVSMIAWIVGTEFRSRIP